MKILNFDKRNGIAKVKTENLDDLWYLSNIIDKGDNVSGVTFRKIKLGGEDDRKQAVVKKKAYITITVEKIEFHKYNDVLRINGLIIEGPEEIPRGSFHTINVEDNTEIEIKKEKWPKYQYDKLQESTKVKTSDILVCAFDREEAYFFKIRRQGYEYLTSIKGQVAKKGYDQQATSFYSEIINILKEQTKQIDYFKIVMASPAFYNDEFQKALNDEGLKKKIVMATCSSVGKTSITEIMSRPELAGVMKDDATASEIKYVEELLSFISKQEKNVYGIEETRKASGLGAIDKLLVTDNLIHKYREEEKFEKLDGLGGIAAILRYEI